MLDAVLEFFRGQAWSGWTATARTLLHIALILVLAWAAHRIARKLIRMLREYLGRQQDNPEEVERIGTLGLLGEPGIARPYWVPPGRRGRIPRRRDRPPDEMRIAEGDRTCAFRFASSSHCCWR